MWKPISTLFQVKGGQFRFRVIATLPYSVTFISYKTIIFIDSYSSKEYSLSQYFIILYKIQEDELLRMLNNSLLKVYRCIRYVFIFITINVT